MLSSMLKEHQMRQSEKKEEQGTFKLFKFIITIFMKILQNFQKKNEKKLLQPLMN